ncbi:MAG: TerD family protein [Thermoguttaceae bacterium]|nr:TerD family protein [Thermoguttaceae bacterium]
MAINLQKGQRVAIGLQHLTVGLGWDPAETGEDFDLDAVACLLAENKKIPCDEFLVYYNNTKSADGSCESTGDDRTGGNSEEGDDEQIIINLSKVDSKITSIVFSASIYEAKKRKQNFGQVQNSYIRICDTNSGEELCKYELCEDFSVETAIEFGRLYLHNGEWKFEATGIGHHDGLNGIVNKYC